MQYMYMYMHMSMSMYMYMYMYIHVSTAKPVKSVMLALSEDGDPYHGQSEFSLYWQFGYPPLFDKPHCVFPMHQTALCVG